MIDIDRTKLKNSMNNKVTRGLFFELSYDNLSNVLYSLKKEDTLEYPSLYKIYISLCLQDPSEYLFANSCFLDWEHWEQVSSSSFFKEYIITWRAELAAALESQYLSKLHELIAKGGKEAFPAIRYLLERLEKPAGASNRGRPTKIASRAYIERTASLEALNAKQVEQDYTRLKN